VIRLGFVALFALPAFLGAQGVPTRTVGKVIAEHPEPFSGVLDVRELAGGGVIVLDAKDNLMQFVSANLQTAHKISREGSGPTEYRQVAKLIPHRGDTTYAYDIMNARFLVIDPRGTAVSTVSLRDASGGLPVGPMSVRGYDQRGRLYYQGLNFSMGKDGPAFSDTAPLLRLDGSAKKVDTLAWLRIGMPSVKLSGDVQKGGGAVRLGMGAYPIVDEWGIMPDGRVIVLRGRDYRIDWIGPTGARSAGPLVPYTPVRVTEADKEQVREANKRMQAQVSKAAAAAAGRANASQAKVPSMSVDAPTEWPEHKPAFAQGALRVRPNGELWIGRLRAAVDKAPLYDVLSSSGALAYRVQLPPRTRLAGVSARFLYVVRIDEDDLEYLGRYELGR
jgi:hypothetical protein